MHGWIPCLKKVHPCSLSGFETNDGIYFGALLDVYVSMPLLSWPAVPSAVSPSPARSVGATRRIVPMEQKRK